jgi:hypothetical protein
MRKHLVFATQSVYQLQLEPLSDCNWRSIIVSGGSTQHLQLGVYINCIGATRRCRNTRVFLGAWPHKPPISLSMPWILLFYFISTSTSIATPQTPQLHLLKGPQLKLWTCSFYYLYQMNYNSTKHSRCNTTNTSIATPWALQLQLWTCNFNNFYQTNRNSTSTPVATRQALQLQFFTALLLQLNKPSSCNSTISSIATSQGLQLQL